MIVFSKFFFASFVLAYVQLIRKGHVYKIKKTAFYQASLSFCQWIVLVQDSWTDTVIAIPKKMALARH